MKYFIHGLHVDWQHNVAEALAKRTGIIGR
jgi:hypothetical protein